MPLDPAANFVRGATDASVDSAQTTISVVDASLFPDPSADGAYNLVLWDADNHPRPDQDADVEIVRVTARDTTADELTVDRGQEGTTGASHPSGSALQLSPTAKMFSDIAGTFNEFYDSATQELTADVNNQSVSTDEASVTSAPTDSTDVARKSETDSLQEDVDGKADDPHGNAAHLETFAVDGDAQPPEEHGDTEHDETVPSQSDVDGKADDPHGNAAHTETYAVDGDAQPPEEHGDTEHDETVPSQSDVDSKADDPHGNAAHSETFAVDGDAQPPETHGDTEHDDTVPSQSDMDAKADDPHGSESHSSEVVHEEEDATLGDTTHDSVSTDVLNSADLTEGAEGDALTLTDNAPELALGTTGAEIITQDAEPPVTDKGEAIWAQFVVDGTEATGAEQDWQHELHTNSVNSVFESDGVVYSGSNDDTVIAADASDGTEIWQHELHTSTVRSVFESDGVVYSGSFDDTVIAADASDGTEIWQHELHTSGLGSRVESVFESDGVVYSGSTDDTVIAAGLVGEEVYYQLHISDGTEWIPVRTNNE